MRNRREGKTDKGREENARRNEEEAEIDKHGK